MTTMITMTMTMTWTSEEEEQEEQEEAEGNEQSRQGPRVNDEVDGICNHSSG